MEFRQFAAMDYAFAKKQTRQENYRLRARKARFYARLVMLLLLGTVTAAAWQDENYGPQMKQYALEAMEKFEAATGEDSTSRMLVQAAIRKLQL